MQTGHTSPTKRKNKCLDSACRHFGISISSINTLIWNSSFCQPFRQGSNLVNWEKSTLGWAQRLWHGAKTCGKGKIARTCSSSRRAATKSAGVSDQTDSLFHLGAKMRVRISVNSSNIEANKAQIISLLRLSLFHISATSKIFHFRTFNFCIGINHVTESRKGSYIFGKCVGLGQCLHKRARNGRFLGAAQNVVKWYENMGEKEKFR